MRCSSSTPRHALPSAPGLGRGRGRTPQHGAGEHLQRLSDSSWAAGAQQAAAAGIDTAGPGRELAAQRPGAADCWEPSSGPRHPPGSVTKRLSRPTQSPGKDERNSRQQLEPGPSSASKHWKNITVPPAPGLPAAGPEQAQSPPRGAGTEPPRGSSSRVPPPGTWPLPAPWAREEGRRLPVAQEPFRGPQPHPSGFQDSAFVAAPVSKAALPQAHARAAVTAPGKAEPRGWRQQDAGPSAPSSHRSTSPI